MSGNDLLVDTNICIYLLNGHEKLVRFLQDQTIYISFITEIELFAFHGHNQASRDVLDSFIDFVSVIDINPAIKQSSIQIRREFKLKLPDTLIAATAMSEGLPFITSDKGFKKVSSLDLILYEF